MTAKRVTDSATRASPIQRRVTLFVLVRALKHRVTDSATRPVDVGENPASARASPIQRRATWENDSEREAADHPRERGGRLPAFEMRKTKIGVQYAEKACLADVG